MVRQRAVRERPGFAWHAPRSLWRGLVEYWDAILVINLSLFSAPLAAALPAGNRYLVYGLLAVAFALVLYRRVYPVVRDNSHYLRARLGLRPPRAAPHYLRALFDEYAGQFDHHLMVGLAYQGPNQLFALVEGHLRPKAPMVVVDLGCGSGLCGPLFEPLARQMIGVDLSPRMLEQASRKNCYDELVEADLLAFLGQQRGTVNLCLAADVLVYFGDLEEPLTGVVGALRPGGLFAFTLEATEAEGWVLQKTGRYAHGEYYVKGLAQRIGFEIVELQRATLRLQIDAPVAGTAWLLRKPEEAG